MFKMLDRYGLPMFNISGIGEQLDLNSAIKKMLSVNHMSNGWAVWLSEIDQEFFINPKFCFFKEELFSCIKEFFGETDIFHVKETVSRITRFKEGFIIEDFTEKLPSIFVDL